MQMIRERTGHHLDAWLSSAEASRLPEFESFAKGIQHDKAAVLAGLTLPWSNGPLEGHVNRLKLLKRSMYGRAKLPRLASACAACGWRSFTFSHRPPCCRVSCPSLHGAEGSRQESRKSMGATANPPTTKRRKEEDTDVICYQ